MSTHQTGADKILDTDNVPDLDSLLDGTWSSNLDVQPIVIEGLLRCPDAAAASAPVQVLLTPFITEQLAPALTVELRKNRMVITDGSIVDALEDAVCVVELADSSLLQVQTTLSFGAAVDLGPLTHIAELLLAEARESVAKLALQVGLVADPELSHAVDVALKLMPASELPPGDIDVMNHKLTATFSKSGVRTIVGNVPIAFVEGRDVSLTASVDGSVAQLVKYEGSGSVMVGSPWYRPGGVLDADQARAKLDVYVVVAAADAACSCSRVHSHSLPRPRPQPQPVVWPCDFVQQPTWRQDATQRPPSALFATGTSGRPVGPAARRRCQGGVSASYSRRCR